VGPGFSPDSEHLGQDVRADAGTLSDPEPVRAEARTHLFSDRTFLLQESIKPGPARFQVKTDFHAPLMRAPRMRNYFEI